MQAKYSGRFCISYDSQTKKEFGHMEQVFYNRTAEQALGDMDNACKNLGGTPSRRRARNLLSRYFSRNLRIFSS